MFATSTRTQEQIYMDFYHTGGRAQPQSYAWGNSVILSGGAGFVVKEYFLIPGGEIHSHYHRESTENWTILEGAVMLSVGAEKIYMTTGESRIIRLGENHSLKNVSRYPMQALMVQCGNNLGIET